MLPPKIELLFRLNRAEYYADFLITPPFTSLMLYLSLSNGMSLYWVVAFAAGAASWTLYEYILHRWLLHGAPFVRDVHALHHANQRDYIALHPLATLAVYGALWLIFGLHSIVAMVGFSVGYVAYSILHTAFHYARIGDRHPLFALKRHHAIHHRHDDANFGVTTTIWDTAFGTKFHG